MYIFNPDNDLALANFGANYTAPASARKMETDLSMLPLWYAEKDSAIFTNGNHRFLEEMQGCFPKKLSGMRIVSEIEKSDEEIVPWGWNPSLRKRFLDMGIDEACLPTTIDLLQLRDYSDRKHAVNILAELKTIFPGFYGESYRFRNLEDMLCYLRLTKKNNVFLKMPLSGSGKGIIRIMDTITDKQIDWSKRVLNKQGAVVAEPVLHKIEDFAMEFSLSKGVAAFEGYSVFQTAASGAYVGNLLLPDGTLEEKLSGYIDLETLYQLQMFYQKRLADFFPDYSGTVGVDMMVCKDEVGIYRVHPCVEINMRMTMGVVAHRFRRNFVHPDTHGRFGITFFKQNYTAIDFHQQYVARYPLVLDNERIRSGYFCLNPVGKDTNYMAYALIRNYPSQ